jgi:hypothetical protein
LICRESRLLILAGPCRENSNLCQGMTSGGGNWMYIG